MKLTTIFSLVRQSKEGFVDTGEIKAFCEVYRNGSITKAASRLFITQPALSRMMTRLESELDRQLFERSPNGVEPTSFAREFYPKACAILSMLDDISESSKWREERFALDVPASHGVLRYTGLELIDEFEKIYPNIKLRVIDMDDRQIAEHIDLGVAELAFLAGPIDAEKYQGDLFSRHRHVLEVHKDDPLAKFEFVSHADLEGRTVALLNSRHVPYANHLRWFEQANAMPEKLIELNEGEVGTSFAVQKKAVSISTDDASAMRSTPDVAIVPFRDPTCSYDIYIVTKLGIGHSQEAEAFKAFALQWIDENRKHLFSWKHSVL